MKSVKKKKKKLSKQCGNCSPLLRIDHEEITIFRLPQSLGETFPIRYIDDRDRGVGRVSLLVTDWQQNDVYIPSL